MASEEYPAERQNSNSLPEGNLPPPEERRQQPVPQMHHDFAADEDKERDPQQSPPERSKIIFVFLWSCSIPHDFKNYGFVNSS